MTQPTLVVMAAGIGSRYGGLKQIDPVGPNGEIIIDYSVYDALSAGFGKVVFILRREIEAAFREGVGRRIESHLPTHYVFQGLDDLPEGVSVPSGREKPWGTAHAVLCCRDVVDGPFAVINADDFYGRSSFGALADHLRAAQDTPDAYDYCMVGYVLERTLTQHGHVTRGICSVDDEGNLEEIHERHKVKRLSDRVCYSEDDRTWIEIPEDSPVSMNMWGFTPSLFAELEARFPDFLREAGDDPKAEFLLPEVVSDLLAEGRARVRVLPTQERWFGVTYPQDKAWVKAGIRELIESGVYPSPLWGEDA
jgi:NDP-sugar pyrophosphorylase family protein